MRGTNSIRKFETRLTLLKTNDIILVMGLHESDIPLLTLGLQLKLKLARRRFTIKLVDTSFFV